jgi:hypothetical protein
MTIQEVSSLLKERYGSDCEYVLQILLNRLLASDKGIDLVKQILEL